MAITNPRLIAINLMRFAAQARLFAAHAKETIAGSKGRTRRPGHVQQWDAESLSSPGSPIALNPLRARQGVVGSSPTAL